MLRAKGARDSSQSGAGRESDGASRKLPKFPGVSYCESQRSAGEVEKQPRFCSGES